MSDFRFPRNVGLTYDGPASSVLSSKLTSPETLGLWYQTFPRGRESFSPSALRTLGPCRPVPNELFISVACFCDCCRLWLVKGKTGWLVLLSLG